MSYLIQTGAVPFTIVHLPAAEALLKVAMRRLLVRVVLVLTTVVLVVKLLGVAPGVTLGLLAVNVVGALGLGETVDLTASEASKNLLGKSVRDSLAWRGVSDCCRSSLGLVGLVLTLLPLSVLEHLHGHEGSTAGEQLVAELGLVVVLVDLVVVVLGITEAEHDCCLLCGLRKVDRGE